MGVFDHYSGEEKEYISSLTVDDVREMDYVSFMALLKETNRPPGGVSALLELARLMGISREDRVLDVGSNTGYVSFELLHLTDAGEIYAIDISEDMVRAAESVRSLYPGDQARRLRFVQGDIRKSPFPDEYFSKIVIGGSLAFVEGRDDAVREMKRILKPWGLIGDLEFYYREPPPECVLDRVNDALGLDERHAIQSWSAEYWTGLYEDNGLEVIFTKPLGIQMYRTREEIAEYSLAMVGRVPFGSEEVREEARKKLKEYMSIFNENNRFLDAVMIIARKRAYPAQVHLFSR